MSIEGEHPRNGSSSEGSESQSWLGSLISRLRLPSTQTLRDVLEHTLKTEAKSEDDDESKSDEDQDGDEDKKE